MKFGNLTITEIIAILSIVSAVSYSIMKFYHLFNKMVDTMDQLQQSIGSIINQNADHEKRITKLEGWRENFKGGKS